MELALRQSLMVISTNYMQSTYLVAGLYVCLKICNSVVNMVVIGLVHGQSLMVISTLLLCKSASPLLCIVRFVIVYM